MSRDGQNVVVTGGVKGNLATTSYGPRLMNRDTASTRPMSEGRRELVMQLDGDVAPSVAVDFVNQTRGTIPAGSLVLKMMAYGETASDITVTITDVDAGTQTAVDIDPAAGAWAVSADLNYSIVKDSQVAVTIAAGDRATLIVEYMAPEAPGDNGVLNRVAAGLNSTTL